MGGALVAEQEVVSPYPILFVSFFLFRFLRFFFFSRLTFPDRAAVDYCEATTFS